MIASNNKTLLYSGTTLQTGAVYSYSVFYIAAALIGNYIVLLAATKHKAIKLDKITVTFIQHIAFCDIGNVVFSYIPGFVSFIWGEWVLGRALAYVRVYIGVLFALSGSMLICGLNAAKLVSLLDPLGRYWMPTTSLQCHVTVSVLWVVSATWPLAQFLVNPGDFYFDYRVMVCMYAYTAPVWRWLAPLCLTLVIILPTIVVMATTAWLVVIARQHRKTPSRQWQGILTVILIAVVYCTSFLPHALYYCFYLGDPHFVSEKRFLQLPSGEVVFVEYGTDGLPLSGFFYTTLCSLGNLVITINNYSNFVVYFFSISSFRDFVKMRVKAGLCITTPSKLVVSVRNSRDCNLSKPFKSCDGFISCRHNAPGNASPAHVNFRRNKALFDDSKLHTI